MFQKINYISLFFFITTTVFSQEKMILKDSKVIPATEIWTFTSNSYTYSGTLNVQIGKNDKVGTLLLEIKTSNTQFYIGGNVYLFLEDGNVITCTDKNIRSVQGENIQAYYVLTPNEINLLKKNKLTDVRFRIIGTETQFSSPTGYFTAHNKIRSFGLADKSYDTQTAINQLFL